MRFPVVGALLVALLPFGGVPASPTVPAERPSGVTARDAGAEPTVAGKFQAAWTRRIPADPVLAQRSRRIARVLAADGRGYANLYDYGIPIYRVTDNTRRRRVECTKRWGRCELERARVPIPRGARPNAGSDRAMVLVHRGRGKVYEFWRARKTDAGWRTAWGTITRLSGDPGEGATGSGISRLAGVVRLGEIKAGAIEHPLVFSTDVACGARFRFPARKTDGRSTRRGCVPEGARVQLDPRVKLGRITMSPGERMVAKALQRYGAYAIDVGAERMAFAFEKPTSRRDPYPNAGLKWDYFAMKRIPWESLRVLRRWDGS